MRAGPPCQAGWAGGTGANADQPSSVGRVSGSAFTPAGTVNASWLPPATAAAIGGGTPPEPAGTAASAMCCGGRPTMMVAGEPGVTRTS